jgi:hypothetical protein
MRNILIRIKSGFGNKIFNIITGLYIQHVNGGNLYTKKTSKSHHEKDTDPTIYDIFPKIKEHYIILEDWDEFDKIFGDDKTQMYCNNFKSYEDFKIETDNNIFVYKHTPCYKYIYEMFTRLPDNIKDIFTINNNLISDSTRSLANQEYVIVHIRFGDKLDFAFKGDIKHLLFTPEFYIKLINKFTKKNYKIYVVTDDIEIVQKFILDKIHGDIELLKLSWWESFYMITKAKYSILSMSTFSFLGTLLNNNLSKAYIATRPDNMKHKILPEEKIIKHTNWVKIKNRKYILNRNFELMKELLDYKKN